MSWMILVWLGLLVTVWHLPFTVATSSPSSAANEFASMMEAYQHRTDKLSPPPFDNHKTNTNGPGKKSDISSSKRNPKQVPISSASATVLTKKETTQSSESRSATSTDKSSSLDQSSKAFTVTSSSGTSMDAPLAAAIQALAKLDVSILPAKSEIQLAKSVVQPQPLVTKEPSFDKGTCRCSFILSYTV